MRERDETPHQLKSRPQRERDKEKPTQHQRTDRDLRDNDGVGIALRDAMHPARKSETEQKLDRAGSSDKAD